MTPIQPAAVPYRCPRCTGPMYGSQPGEYCCLYCGEYLFSEFPRGRTAEEPRLERSAGRHRPRPRRTAAVA